LEGDPSLAVLATGNFRALGLSRIEVVQGRFQDTFVNVLKKHAPIEFAFIDGHHDRQATREYFDQLRTNLAQQSVVVFDDVFWSRGMHSAWKEIRASAPPGIAVSLGRMGIYLT
ncbi:MAG: class I SAM-dependent methyltransferase, partial [Ignavibacteriales bacterium]|nr:class I SAM-dependent methyltransferase [Ignavibacteriales bacterium]